MDYSTFHKVHVSLYNKKFERYTFLNIVSPISFTSQGTWMGTSVITLVNCSRKWNDWKVWQGHLLFVQNPHFPVLPVRWGRATSSGPWAMHLRTGAQSSGSLFSAAACGEASDARLDSHKVSACIPELLLGKELSSKATGHVVDFAWTGNKLVCVSHWDAEFAML